jgi:hypothetical protein
MFEKHVQKSLYNKRVCFVNMSLFEIILGMMVVACLGLDVVQSCLVRAMMLHTHAQHTHSESLTRTTIGLKLRPKTLGSNQDPHFAWGNVAVRAFSVPARGEGGRGLRQCVPPVGR